MAQLAIGLAGAAIGGAVAPVGFSLLGLGGAQLGFLGGALLGGALFPGPTTVSRGPRIEDLRVQVSTLGRPIPRVHGTYQVAGNVIWSAGIKETAVKEEVGGKGGLTGPSQKSVRYLYSASLAIGICAGPIAGVLRIKADGKLVADYRAGNTGPTVGDAAAIRVHLGGETQVPDPLLQADLGVADTPAYRGLAYVVVEELQLADFGNRIPNFSFEVATEGSAAFPLVSTSGVNAVASSGEDFFRGPDGLFYSFAGSDISVFDPIGQRLLFDDAIADPNGVSTLGSGGGVAVRDDGEYAYVMGTDGNFSKLNTVHLGSMSVLAAIGPGPTFSFPFAGRFDFPAGSATVRTRRHAFDVFTGADGEASIRPQLIAAHWVGGIAGGNKIVVVNPNIAAYAPQAHRYGIVGEIAAGSEIGAGRTLGWPALDDDLNVWCASTDASRVWLHRFRFDLFRDGEYLRNPPGQEKFSGPDTLPLESAESEITAAIVELGGGGVTVRLAWVREANALLLELAGYVYLFDCTSGTVVGGALRVTTNGAQTTTKTALQGGVQADGRMIFKWDAGTLALLDVYNWTVEPQKYELADWGGIGTTQHGGGYVPELNAWVGLSKPNARTLFLDRFGDGAKPLDRVMSDELLLSGLAAGEIDLGALAGDAVSGYAVATQGRVRDNVEALARLHRFDLVEIDSRLTAVRRGGALAFAIPEADQGAYAAGAARPVSLLESRAAEQALPWRIDLTYVSRAAEYEPATQHDKRVDEATASRRALSLSTPEVLDDDSAKQAVRALLAEAWEAALEYETALGPKYLRLDPSDRGTLARGGAALPVRVLQTDLGADWIVRLRARRDSGSIYAQAAAGTPVAYPSPDGIGRETPSRMFLLDLPLLRDADNSFGLYVAAGPRFADAAWPGALISDSDDGVAFEALADLPAAATYGFAVDRLPEQPRWTVVDRTSSLTLRLVAGEPPASVSDGAFMNNGSAWLIGEELVLVRDVADNGDGTYTFSHLLRARLGTEDRLAGHAPGERVVRLDAGAVRRVRTSIARLDRARYFRVDTLGAGLPSTVFEVFTNGGRCLRPLSPFHVQVARQGNGDLVVTWVRRTRLAEGWRGRLAAALGETAERYRIVLYDPAGLAVRSVTVSGATAYTYARAEQIADGNGGDIGQPILPLSLANPGFESGDLTGWTVEAGAAAVVTSNPHSGGFHLRCSGGAGVTDVVIGDSVDLVAAGLDAGDLDNRAVVLRVAAWWYNENPANNALDRCWMGVRFYDAAMAELSTDAATPSAVGGYELVSHLATPPGGTRYAAAVLFRKEGHSGGTGLSHKMGVDDVSLEWAPVGSPDISFDLQQLSDAVGPGIPRRVTV
jgi:Putative phage tail protein